MLGEPVICATVPTEAAVKRRHGAEERHGSDEASFGLRRSGAGNVVVLDEGSRQLSIGLRLSLTTAPDAQSPI